MSAGPGLPPAIGDGLVLRRAALADTEALAAFNARIHSDEASGMPEEALDVWTREMMSGRHPAVTAEDFTVVEDEASGEIVSSLNLISQTWSYGGIPFGIGQIEVVGTAEAMRRRGLVRAQMEVAHGWSAERGQVVQGITGIPYYYRRFRYDMALELGGGRIAATARVPALGENAVERFTFRPAVSADAPFLSATFGGSRDRYRVADRWEEEQWRWAVAGRDPVSLVYLAIDVMEDELEDPVGLVVRGTSVRNSMVRVYGFEVAGGAGWWEAGPALLRHSQRVGDELAGDDAPVGRIALLLGTEHPVYEVLPQVLDHVAAPYAWYIRISDVPGFLRHVAPALEWRLGDSVMSGFTGKFELNLSGSGAALDFEDGLISGVRSWTPADFDDGDVLFPDLTFLQVLFGFRSFRELEHSYTDCIAGSDAGRALVDALFPQGPSQVLGFN